MRDEARPVVSEHSFSNASVSDGVHDSTLSRRPSAQRPARGCSVIAASGLANGGIATVWPQAHCSAC